MSRTLGWISLFGLLLACTAPSPAAAEDSPSWLRPQADYMAHTVMTAEGSRIRGRVWAGGGNERRELQVKGSTHIVIRRKDRGVSWILMPTQRMYLEQGLDASPTERFEGGRIEREAQGREDINGASATKYRVHGETAAGEAFEAWMWMTDEEIPVRVITGEGDDRVEIVLEKLSVGSIDPRRFEIPHGYTKFDLPAPAKAELDALRRRHGGR